MKVEYWFCNCGKVINTYAVLLMLAVGKYAVYARRL